MSESTCTVVKNKLFTVVRGIYTLLERTSAVDRRKQGKNISMIVNIYYCS